MAGGVRGPRDTIDRGSVVAQSGHWYAGHSDIKNYYLVIKRLIITSVDQVTLYENLKYCMIIWQNRYSCSHLSALKGESGKVVWVLLVPTQPEKRQLLGVLIEYGRMLKIPARTTHTHNEYPGELSTVDTCTISNICINRVEPLYNGHHWDQRFCPL